MNQNTVFAVLVNLVIFLFAIRESLSAVDPHYTACKEPKYCGNQKIKFPFYIQEAQDKEGYVCGYPYPGFNLSCIEDQPILRLSDNDYVVNDIIYPNQSFRVSVAAFSQNSTTKCIPPTSNITLPGDRFTLVPNLSDVVVFYNCNSPLSTAKIGCSGENETLAVLATEEGNSNFVNASKECGRVVKVPVEEDGWEKLGIKQKLRRGFHMKWTATNCSLCENSGGFCGFDLDLFQFQCYCTDRPHFKACVVPSPGNNHLRLKLGLGIGCPAVLIIGSLICILNRSRKKKYGPRDIYSTNTSSYPSKADLECGSFYFGVPVFSYGELQKATNNFDHSKELGDGGFGTVYYGKLHDGREVAVKRLYEHNYKRVEQFMNEIKILTCLRHKNLVSLYGCTSRHSHELLLVYEFVPNGTVADHLHGDRAKLGLLSWPIRLSIAIETASALAYLHASDIIHRDVKTNNILLDNNFSVKVADFGLSRLFPNDVTHVSTAPQGTPGYVDPEYHQCYQLTNKSDVYSFGVVLIELISSMPAVDISRHRHEINLSNLAINKIQNQAYDELVDPNLGFKSDSSLRRMTVMVAELAFRCLQQDKEMRPSMDEVLEALQDIRSGKCDLESVDKVHIDNVGMKSMQPTPSPECDDIDLLKKFRQPSSPISVTEKWISRSTTPSSSA